MPILPWPLTSKVLRFQCPPQHAPRNLTPVPVAELQVRQQSGGFVKIRFQVDTGSEVTTMPLALAQRCDIVAGKENLGRGSLRTPGGSVDSYVGTIEVSVLGRIHRWTCHFVESAPEQKERLSRPVLGRRGLMDEYELTFDRQFLTIVRPGLFRLLRRKVWALLGLYRPSG